MIWIILSTPGLAQSAEEPMVNDTQIDSISVLQAMRLIAQNIDRSQGACHLIYEGWMDDFYPVFDGETLSFELYPNSIKIDVNFQSCKISGALEQIAAETGTHVWEKDSQNSIYIFSHKGLKSDPNWPLNKALKQEDIKQMNCSEIKQVLYEKYDCVQLLRGYCPEKDENSIIWNPDPNKNYLVKDLVYAWVKSLPDNYVYMIKPSPDLDVTQGYSDFKNREEIKWNIVQTTTINIETIQRIKNIRTIDS